MNRTTVVALALAGLAVLGFVGAGAATASPGAAPDGVPADDRTDDATGGNESATADDDRGPPSDAPAAP